MFHSKLSLLNIAVHIRPKDNILQGLQDQLYVFVESFWW